MDRYGLLRSWDPTNHRQIGAHSGLMLAVGRIRKGGRTRIEGSTLCKNPRNIKGLGRRYRMWQAARTPHARYAAS